MLSIKRVDLEEAKKLLAAAEGAAEAIGVPMAIAVTDESGNLVAFSRMDGAKITSIAIAIDKAFTAAGVRRSTHDLGLSATPGGASFGIHSANGGRMMVFGGGAPVMIGGHVVGAIGVSSGTVDQDRQVAEVAVAVMGDC